jgi:hypothetical protein
MAAVGESLSATQEALKEGKGVDSGTIMIVVIAVLVLAGIAYWTMTRGRQRAAEEQRERAAGHREEARAQARDAGEAELVARRKSEEAERMRQRAEEAERKAADTDPDSKR